MRQHGFGKLVWTGVFSLMLTLAAGALPAQADDDEMVYGRELMTDQELLEHRQKMRTLKGEEREAYRKEHHEKMEERAKEQGKTIPDEPMERGKGMRQGAGPGPGPGMGQGRGPGR